MKAVRVHEYGGPEVLTYEDVPDPTPAPGEVLVEMKVIGVNYSDTHYRRGNLRNQLPTVPGHEGSGVVAALGEGVTQVKVGDRVAFAGQHRLGTYKELMTLPATEVVTLPGATDFKLATAVLNQGQTAHYLAHDAHPLKKGERVLIHAAAGGVGHLAAQIAKAVGAEVIGTARAAKHDFLRRIGVDEPVDYTAVDVGDVVGGVDVVLDCVGGDAGRRSLPCLRPGGMLIVVPSASDPGVLVEARERGLRATGILVEPDYASLERLDALVAEGKLRPEIDTVLPLAEAAKAHEIGEQGRTQGKLVLRTG